MTELPKLTKQSYKYIGKYRRFEESLEFYPWKFEECLGFYHSPSSWSMEICNAQLATKKKKLITS